MIRARLHGFARSSIGSAFVETALALSVGIPLCLYGFEVCMFTYTDGVLADAAKQGVHYAISHGSDSSNCSGPSTGCADSSAQNVKTVVQNAAAISFHNMTNLAVTVTYSSGSCAPGSPVIVKVKYTYVPYLNFPGLAQQLNATSEGIIVY